MGAFEAKVALSWPRTRLLPRRCGVAVLAFVALPLIAPAAVAASATSIDRPERIVSMNLCADHLVWELAERNRIVSVSYNSTFPEQSLIADKIGDMPVNRGLAEEILPLSPDLIVTGAATTPFATALLRDRGYTIVEVPMANDLDAIRQNVKLVSAAIGSEQRGDALLRRFDLAVERLQKRHGDVLPSGIVLMAGGFTAGRNTVADALLELAGLTNAMAELGIDGWINLSLERFLTERLDVIVMGADRRTHNSLSNALLEHPALQSYAKARSKVEVPSRLWTCGTTAITEAAVRIADAVDGAKPSERP